MNKIEEKCKTKGVRLTDQRRLIAKVMSEATDHPDVDELHKRVSKIDKLVSPLCTGQLNFLRNQAFLKSMISKAGKQDMNNHLIPITII